MSRRGRLIGLAIAVALLANGIANKANAGPGACKPVQACAPVTAAPAVPVCKPVKALPPEVCKPAKPLPLSEVCKPVKACDGVDAHAKYVVLQDRIARFVGHFKRHGTGKEVYYDAPQPAPSQTPPTPAPAPRPAAA
jgi:hypothetical protein